jgi:Xaa-Pro aminopeptidase
MSTPAPYAARQHALRAALHTRGLRALLVTHPVHVRWLCGFTGSNGWLLLRSRDAVFVTDPRYEEQAAAEVREARILHAGTLRLSEALQQDKAFRNLRALGIEEEHVTVALQRSIAERCAPARPRAVAGVLEGLRERKSSDEIDCIRRAIAISEQVLHEVLRELRPGVSERDIAAEITYRHRRAGADGDAFPPIVLFGRVTVKFRRMYEQLRASQEEARAAVTPGMTASALDAFARASLERADLARYFTHALGHGLGLDVHEAPILSSRNNATLRAGMVVTIEPGLYLPGEGGMRLEDDVLVTPEGGETLTSLSRDWLEL